MHFQSDDLWVIGHHKDANLGTEAIQDSSGFLNHLVERIE
jgi:hypothetical protein